MPYTGVADLAVSLAKGDAFGGVDQNNPILSGKHALELFVMGNVVLSSRPTNPPIQIQFATGMSERCLLGNKAARRSTRTSSRITRKNDFSFLCTGKYLGSGPNTAINVLEKLVAARTKTSSTTPGWIKVSEVCLIPN